MFIKSQHPPSVEFSPADGHTEPTIVHYFSNLAEPLESALPLLTQAGDDERVLVVESPLSEIVDRTIWLNRHPDFPDRPVIDKRQRAFFEAAKAALLAAAAKIDGIEYAALDDEEEGD